MLVPAPAWLDTSRAPGLPAPPASCSAGSLPPAIQTGLPRLRREDGTLRVAQPGPGWPPRPRKLAWSVTFTEIALTSPTCHLEARGLGKDDPTPWVSQASALARASGGERSRPGRGSLHRGALGARPGRAAGGSSADVVRIMELGHVAWSLSTQVCGARRVCQAEAVRTAHGRPAPVFRVCF